MATLYSGFGYTIQNGGIVYTNSFQSTSLSDFEPLGNLGPGVNGIGTADFGGFTGLAAWRGGNLFEWDPRIDSWNLITTCRCVIDVVSEEFSNLSYVVTSSGALWSINEIGPPYQPTQIYGDGSVL